MATPRAIRKVIAAVEQSEGNGARVRRAVGTHQMQDFSPFILAENYTIGSGSGFPDHLHRGQEWLTYGLKGDMDYEDFTGNIGTLKEGGVQYMTAGRGMMHAEMPHEDTEGCSGVQVWVDLPEELKMCEPRHGILHASDIPNLDTNGGKVHIKIISGKSHGVEGPRDLVYTPIEFLDVEIQPGGKFTETLPAGWNAFAYTLSGRASFGAGVDKVVASRYHNVVFELMGDAIHAEVEVDAGESGRFLLFAGPALDQKVIQYGPFVLASQDAVYQSISDYQNYENGFERARTWKSEIGNRLPG